jgi:hypothetical protein
MPLAVIRSYKHTKTDVYWFRKVIPSDFGRP